MKDLLTKISDATDELRRTIGKPPDYIRMTAEQLAVLKDAKMNASQTFICSSNANLLAGLPVFITDSRHELAMRMQGKRCIEP